MLSKISWIKTVNLWNWVNDKWTNKLYANKIHDKLCELSLDDNDLLTSATRKLIYNSRPTKVIEEYTFTQIITVGFNPNFTSFLNFILQ
jgi:hypothetical protein